MAHTDPFDAGHINFEGPKTNRFHDNGPSLPTEDEGNPFAELNFTDSAQQQRETIREAAAEPPTPRSSPRPAGSTPSLPHKAKRKTPKGRGKAKKSFFPLNTSSQPPHNPSVIGTVKLPVSGSFVVTTCTRKGGVGSTTCLFAIGNALAEHRNAKVIIADFTPEGGELNDLVVTEHDATIGDFAAVVDTVSSYRHVRQFTSMCPSGLEVLGTNTSRVNEPPLTPDKAQAIIDCLTRHYDIVLVDAGSVIRSPTLTKLLERTDHLLIVSAGAGGMRGGIWTANHLTDQVTFPSSHCRHLVDGMTVIINEAFQSSVVSPEKAAEAFEQVGRKAVRVPFDPAVEGGAPFDLSAASASFQNAITEAAASIVSVVRAERSPR